MMPNFFLVRVETAVDARCSRYVPVSMATAVISNDRGSTALARLRLGNL